MKPAKLFLLLAIGTSTVISCKSNQGDNNEFFNSKGVPGELKIADSIIYDVVIRAIDIEDPWEVQRLNTFNQKKFIDLIFDQLYKGKYTAYNFDTRIKLTIDEIKEIESNPDFNRLQISKVQFNEEWYADSSGVINKRINSITLGIESHSKQGTFLGHHALFIVKFEPIVQ